MYCLNLSYLYLIRQATSTFSLSSFKGNIFLIRHHTSPQFNDSFQMYVLTCYSKKMILFEEDPIIFYNNI